MHGLRHVQRPPGHRGLTRRDAPDPGRARVRRSGVPAGRPAAVPVEPGTARIAVDLLGGDDAPAVVVDGALRACGADPDLHLLLVGPREVADEVIGALPADRPRPRRGRRAVGRAPSAWPTRRARAAGPTPPSRAAVAAVAEGAADALVSAGATGATVTAAVLGLGRWPGVRRPALRRHPARPRRPGRAARRRRLAARPGRSTLVRHAAARRRVRRRRRTASPRPRVGLLSDRHRAGQGRPRPPGRRPRARRPARWPAAPATSASSRATTSPPARAPTSSSPTASPATSCSRASRARTPWPAARRPAAARPGPPRCSASPAPWSSATAPPPATTSPPASRSPPTCTAAGRSTGSRPRCRLTECPWRRRPQSADQPRSAPHEQRQAPATVRRPPGGGVRRRLRPGPAGAGADPPVVRVRERRPADQRAAGVPRRLGARRGDHHRALPQPPRPARGAARQAAGQRGQHAGAGRRGPRLGPRRARPVPAARQGRGDHRRPGQGQHPRRHARGAARRDLPPVRPGHRRRSSSTGSSTR